MEKRDDPLSDQAQLARLHYLGDIACETPARMATDAADLKGGRLVFSDIKPGNVSI